MRSTASQTLSVETAHWPVHNWVQRHAAAALSVAEWISQSPSVHDSYFVGDRIATHDELANTMEENPNIFRCKVNWGCFWQEKPEDEIALYRELMNCPVFSYIHEDFWLRELQIPRLAAWNENDQQRIPMVWNSFVQELNVSTNIYIQLEAKAIEFADAETELKMAVAFTNLFNGIFENSDALVDNSIEVLYLNWGIDNLVAAKTGNGAYTDTKESLNHLFYSEYRPKLEMMDQEYWSKTVPAAQLMSGFEKQKEYLKDNEPYDFMEFAKTFGSRDYTKGEALEIQPLIAAYKSNLVAQSQIASGMQNAELFGAIAQVGFLENDVNRILNPPAPKPKIDTAQQTNPTALLAVRPTAVPGSPEAPPDIPTNILLVKNHLEIPSDRFSTANITGFKISNSHWSNGKLLLDLVCSGNSYQNGFEIVGGLSLAAAAIYDPANNNWEIVEYPEHNTNAIGINFETRNIELFKDELYLSVADEIHKCDLSTRQWETLSISGQNNSRLFAVDGHLYAANGETIFEITDDGKSTHILASTRRRPAVSALDSLDDLGSPILFSGLNQSLCASVGNKIYSWDGNDWREILTVNISQPPEVFEDGVVFRSSPSYGSDEPASLWIWKKDQSAPELCLLDKPKRHTGIINSPFRKLNNQNLPPRWQSLDNEYLTSSSATFFKSNLYFFVDHVVVTNVAGRWTVSEEDGYHAKLVCLSQDSSEPIVVPLKFDTNLGQPPLKSLGEKFEQAPWLTGSTWMYFAGDALYIGQPDSPTIWTIPVSGVEVAIATQKRILLTQTAQAMAATKQAQLALLAKYDRNHNGVIDPDEREAALDDPAFIESELDVIDAKHNGWLDADELAYFDANKNKILEPKEQAGIEIAQHLLAERLLKKFDVNGDGFLDRMEFNNLYQSCFGANNQSMNAFSTPFPDDNHDGKIDLGELQSFLEQQTRRSLRSHERHGAAFFNQMRMNASQPFDPRQMFKAEVEFYWQHPGGGTNRSPFNNGIPSGVGITPNGMQQNTPP
jgi:Ca2+-binding EF-hand superfamily protein